MKGELPLQAAERAANKNSTKYACGMLTRAQTEIAAITCRFFHLAK